MPKSSRVHLRGSRLCGKFADYTIIADGISFPAHKDILCRYTYFGDTFSESSAKTIKYDKYSEKAVEICLTYIYRKVLIMDTSHAIEVIQLSNLWNLRYVTTKCEQILKTTVTWSNCIEMRKLATQTTSRDLGKAANEVILLNEHLLRGEELRILSRQDIKSIKDFTMRYHPTRIDNFRSIFFSWIEALYPSGGHGICELIAEYHSELLTSKLLHSIQPDDLLNYLREVDVPCTAKEFTSIVAWMETDSDREYLFPHIFEFAEHPERESGKKFLTSFVAFVWFSEGMEEENACWWPRYGFYLKTLAKRFSYDRTERLIDVCFSSDFATVIEDQRYLDFESKDLQRYFSTSSTYDSDEYAIWRGFIDWIYYDFENRKQYFIEIFESMKLEKFSSEFICRKVLENDLVVASNKCMALVMKYVINSNNRIDAYNAQAYKHI